MATTVSRTLFRAAVMAAETPRADRFSPDRHVDDVTPEMMIVGATLGILMVALALYLI